MCVCKIDIIFVVEQLVGKWTKLHTWKDSDSEIPCLQPALLSTVASTEHKLALSWCSGTLSTLTLSCSFISLQGQCRSYTPSKPAQQSSLPTGFTAGTGLLCPGLDYASPFIIVMLPLVPPQLHHSTPSFTSLRHCCLFICTRNRWHRQNSIRRLTSTKQATCQGWATYCKAPFHLKCLFQFTQPTLTSGTCD